MSARVENIDIIISLVQKGSNAVTNIAKQLRNLKTNAESASKSTSKLSKSLDKTKSTASSAAKSLDKTAKSSKNVKKETVSAGKALKGMNGSLSSFVNTIQRSLLVQFIKESANAIVDVSLKWTRLSNTLSYVFESSTETAEALQFLRETSNRLGVSLESSVEGFAQMAAAAKGSKLEGEGVRDVYTALVTTGSALGLSQHKLSNIFYAITQMMSKGTVQTEELKRQLGDQLPGAMDKAAQSMGLTKTAFVELVESGRLLSDDFLPKFAAFLTNEMTPAAERNAIAMVGSFAKMQTAWFEFKIAITEGDMGKVLKNIFDGITEALQDKAFISSVTAIVKFFGDMTLKVLDLVKTGPSLILWVTGLTSALGLFGGLALQLGTMIVSLKTLSATLLAVKTVETVGNLESVGSVAATSAGEVTLLSKAIGFLLTTTAGISSLVAAIGLATYAAVKWYDAETGNITAINDANKAIADQDQALEQLNSRLYEAELATGLNVKNQDDLNRLVAYGVISYNKNTGAISTNLIALEAYKNGTAKATVEGANLAAANAKLVGIYDDVYDATGRVITTEHELNDLVAAGVISIDEHSGAVKVDAENLKAMKDGTLVVNGALQKLNEELSNASKGSMADFAKKLIEINNTANEFSLDMMARELALAGEQILLVFNSMTEGINLAEAEYLKFTSDITDMSLINAYFDALNSELDRRRQEGIISAQRYNDEKIVLEQTHLQRIVDLNQEAFDKIVASGDTSSKAFMDALKNLKTSQLDLANSMLKTTSTVSDELLKSNEAHKASLQKIIDDSITELARLVTEGKNSSDQYLAVQQQMNDAQEELNKLRVESSKSAFDEINAAEIEAAEKRISTITSSLAEMVQAGRQGTEEYLQLWVEFNQAQVELDNARANSKKESYNLIIANLKIALAEERITEDQYHAQSLAAEKTHLEARVAARKAAAIALATAGKEGTDAYEKAILSLREAELELIGVEKDLTEVVTDTGGKFKSSTQKLKDYVQLMKDGREASENWRKKMNDAGDATEDFGDDAKTAGEKGKEGAETGEIAWAKFAAQVGVSVSELKAAISTITSDLSRASLEISAHHQRWLKQSKRVEFSPSSDSVVSDFEGASFASIQAEISKQQKIIYSMDQWVSPGEKVKAQEIIVELEELLRNQSANVVSNTEVTSDNTATTTDNTAATVERTRSAEEIAARVEMAEDRVIQARENLANNFGTFGPNIQTVVQAMSASEDAMRAGNEDLAAVLRQLANSLEFLDVVKGYASGGVVPGIGAGDTVPAMLTPGEYVIKKSIVSSLGSKFFDFINNKNLNSRLHIPSINNMFQNTQRFAEGGIVKDSEKQVSFNLNLNGKSFNASASEAVGMALLQELELANLTAR